jgi:hypothetical protein
VRTERFSESEFRTESRKGEIPKIVARSEAGDAQLTTAVGIT